MIWLMSSLGFLFVSHPRHGVEEASDPDMPMGTDKKRKKEKKPNKNLISLANGQEKDNPERQILLGNSCSALAKHHRKNCGLTLPVPAKAEWGG